MSAPDFPAWSALALARVEQALTDWVPAAAPARLGDAMRYAVLDGGKRLRPLLVLASAEAVQGNGSAALRAACAVELIHAYSLVHDDMPCMDNDVLRRGKPTVHVQYGEAQALLAGDALQALAFELLTPEGDAVPPAMQAAQCGLLARAAGAAGMAGGQAIDLASVGRVLTEAELRAMHRLKTGALLQAAVPLPRQVMNALVHRALDVGISVAQRNCRFVDGIAERLGEFFHDRGDWIGLGEEITARGQCVEPLTGRRRGLQLRG